MIGLGRVIYHISTLSVVIRKTFEIFTKLFYNVVENWFAVFEIESKHAKKAIE